MSEDEPSGWTQKILSSPWILWAFIVFGVAFRIIQYWNNRSLWLDEAMLSSSILNRSYWDLLKPPLDYDQYSPMGFLWIERFCASLIHPLEYGLRFFPLLCGIISVFAFWRLTRYLLAPIGQAAALSLFSCGHYLIYYSSEVKQYSTEVLVCVTLIWTCLRFREPAPTWGKTLLLGILGAAAIWLSFSAVFILAGIGASLVFFAMRNKNKKDLLLLLPILTLWAASFLVQYYRILRNTPHLPEVIKEWENLNGFWPFPPASISDLLWPWTSLQTFIANPLGMEIILPFTVLMAAGFWVLGRKAPGYCLVVCITVGLAVAAAAMRQYPFALRTIVYLVPLALIGVGAAVDKIWEILYPAHTGLFLLIVLAVFYTPIKGGFHQAWHPIVHTEIKPALELVSQKARPGDGIYVYRYAMPAYLVYQNSYPALRQLKMYSTPLRYSTPTQPEVDEQLRQIRAHTGRVWLLFAHTGVEEVSYRYYMRYFLDHIGRQLSSYEKDNVWLYLYALPESAPAIGSPHLPPRDRR
jgi:hypothetical protein